MKPAVLSESASDEAAVRILLERLFPNGFGALARDARRW
jgi:hypothetical protein